MLKRILSVMFILLLGISGQVFAAEAFESPSYITISTETYESGKNKGDYYFNLQWKNPDSVMNLGSTVSYEIDFKEGNNPWLSEAGKKLRVGYLKWDEKKMSNVTFDPVAENVVKDKINIKENHYSFRIRYSHNGTKGEFSNVGIAGLTDYYRNSSKWAKVELDRALKSEFITNAIRDDMSANVTREEFAEVLMKMYVKITGKTVSYSDTFFSDTENPEVLKAAELGIITGNGYGQFKPNEKVTRQEITTMLIRALKLLRPNNDFSTTNVNRFGDQDKIDDWAIEGMKYMYKNGILKGNGYGKIDPKGNASREVATILILRTYEKFK